MSTFTSPQTSMQPRDLGNGLIARWSRPEDADELAYIQNLVFRDSPDEPTNAPLIDFVQKAMRNEVPLMRNDEFALVEDTRRSEHRIVAATCLWHQRWDYEGIPLKVGQPELVVTDPEYRNRGLIRTLIEMHHARSEAEGDHMQVIMGIPYFYRQFGYEYVLELDARASLPVALIPPAKEGEPEPVVLRDAQEGDLPAIQALYEQRRAGVMVSNAISEEWWRYCIRTWPHSRTGDNWRVEVISDATGAFLGYVLPRTVRAKEGIYVDDIQAVPGVNLQAIIPALLRAIYAQGPEFATRGSTREISKFIFQQGGSDPEYPLYAALEKSLEQPLKRQPPYAWYVRVADLPAFMRHIAPVLERRLQNSPVSGYSGDLKLNFYRGGMRLHFERGRLTEAAPWKRPPWNIEEEDASFPPLLFLQLLFCYRSLDELRYTFPDVQVEERAELLLKALFPKKRSWVMSIG